MIQSLDLAGLTAMRLPRMTTRRWMIVVAIMAFVFGIAVAGLRLKRRHDVFRDLAAMHARLEFLYREQRDEKDKWAAFEEAIAKSYGLLGMDSEGNKAKTEAVGNRANSTRCALRADHHGAMRRKYERASSRPWLFIEPDPPDPSP